MCVRDRERECVWGVGGGGSVLQGCCSVGGEVRHEKYDAQRLVRLLRTACF